MRVVADPTIALKAALHTALRQHDMTVADLAERLDVDWRQAVRLIDPKRSIKLTSRARALGVLGCTIDISVGKVEPQGGGVRLAVRMTRHGRIWPRPLVEPRRELAAADLLKSALGASRNRKSGAAGVLPTDQGLPIPEWPQKPRHFGGVLFRAP